MDFTPDELVNTVVHQAHVIRRLELALATMAQRIALLEAAALPDDAPLASAAQRTDTGTHDDPSNRERP